MVSIRCKLIVKDELTRLKLPIVDTELGAVEIHGEITQDQREILTKNLLRSGMELLDDTRSNLIKKIELEIIDLISNSVPTVRIDFSDALTQKLGYQPAVISSIFAEVKGISLNQFIVIQKIERAKELVLYDEMTTLEIASLLGFNSREDLVYQFKKITGLTPSFFKVLRQKRRGVGKVTKKGAEPTIVRNQILD